MSKPVDDVVAFGIAIDEHEEAVRRHELAERRVRETRAKLMSLARQATKRATQESGPAEGER